MNYKQVSLKLSKQVILILADTLGNKGEVDGWKHVKFDVSYIQRTKEYWIARAEGTEGERERCMRAYRSVRQASNSAWCFRFPI